MKFFPEYCECLLLRLKEDENESFSCFLRICWNSLQDLIKKVQRVLEESDWKFNGLDLIFLDIDEGSYFMF